MWLIYKITNALTGVAYVGLISDLQRQIHSHQRKETVGSIHFDIEILFDNIPSRAEAYEMEKVFIDMYATFENGANQTRGGGGGVGRTKSREPKKYLSKGQRAQSVVDSGSRDDALDGYLTPSQRAQMVVREYFYAKDHQSRRS